MITFSNTMPHISIIMSSYNHDKYISAAIESVLSQTVSNFELIIIDDASNDRSRKIIESYTEKDERIRAIYHKYNKGISCTINHGLSKATGKYVAFIASDDVWYRYKLEKELTILKNDENLVVISEASIIDDRGNPTGQTFSQIKNAVKRNKCGNILEELLNGNFVHDLILKRGNLKSLKYDEQLKYLNDYQFVVDLSSQYNFFFIPEPLSMYRIHGQNTMTSDVENWRRDIIKFGQDVLRKYGRIISKRTKARVYITMAASYVKLGNRAKSREFLFKALKIKPFDWRHLIFLASYIKNGIGQARKSRCS